MVRVWGGWVGRWVDGWAHSWDAGWGAVVGWGLGELGGLRGVPGDAGNGYGESGWDGMG